ncbi:MAG: glycosyltransferase family 4 protein [Pirellulales bacterium]
MRVAHIITRMVVGGAQENTLYNCQDLITDFGDEVLLVSGPARGPEGDLLGQGRGIPVPTQIVPSLVRNISPLQDWQSYFALKRVLKEFRPDVVHTHSAKAGILGRMAGWSLRIPAVVHTVHGAPFHPYQSFAARKFFAACEWYGARKCHAMICVADAMTDLMVSAGVAPKSKFTTIFSGMEVEPFVQANQTRQATRAELGIADDEIVVGKIARLFHLKGHRDVILAAKEVVAKHPKTKFLFVGDGILRGELEAEIAKHGLQGNFVFTGLVPPQQIPRYLGAMDLLVHASLREGLARALPQALIAGKPVVSYDVDGAREVCITGETGYLLPPQDISGLAEAIGNLVVDKELRDRLGQEGQKRFRQQFDHHFMTQRIRSLYEGLLQRSGSGK